MARCRPPIPAKPERLPEIRHQHDIRLALPAREGELLSIGRPGEGKHIVTREVGYLYWICSGERLRPDIGSAIARKHERERLVVRGEFARTGRGQ